ncbi:MAG: hypothetical protein OXF05_08425 [Hyphomicrobiales bacterium]|nr:hypothetical protein [Hyphomicrobiales bacterium]
MTMQEMMDDLVAAGLMERPRENASPGPDPDNYTYAPTVTFYKMPEPPPLSLPSSEAEDTSEEDTSEDA